MKKILIILLCFISGCQSIPNTKNGYEWEGVYKVYNQHKNFIGTCVRIGPGEYVTAGHVVQPVTSEYYVSLDFLIVDNIKINVSNDVAILRTNEITTDKSYNIGYNIVLGESVYVLSYSDSDRIYSQGYISSYNINGRISYTGSVRPGMSGSPVINNKGEVVGILTSCLIDNWDGYLVFNTGFGLITDYTAIRSLKNE